MRPQAELKHVTPVTCSSTSHSQLLREELSKQLVVEFAVKLTASVLVSKCFVAWALTDALTKAPASSRSPSKITEWPPPLPFDTVNASGVQQFRSSAPLNLSVGRLPLETYAWKPSVGTWLLPPGRRRRDSLVTLMEAMMAAQFDAMKRRNLAGLCISELWKYDFRSCADWNRLKAVSVAMCAWFQCRQTIWDALMYTQLQDNREEDVVW